MTAKEKVVATVKPKDFSDLDAKELYRSAVEDFALPVEADDNKKVLLAAFVEGGVTFDDYIEQHPEAGPDEEDKAAAGREVETTRPGSVITLEKEVKGLSVSEEPKVVVQEPVKVNPSDQYLIKMVRDNPLFEVRGYKFTSAHPYALVSADDAQHILEFEDGFRQALPSELSEFYG